MLHKIKHIFLEPFFHFILLGTVLYMFYNSTQKDNDMTKEIINISEYETTQLKNIYQTTYSKKADEKTVQYLIKNRVYEKILLKEARSLKLDQTDPIIVNRMIKKMHFIMTNESANIEPTEEELYLFYKKNIKDYSQIKDISFSHIFLDTFAIKKATDLLKLLTIADVNPKDAKSFSDKLEGNSQLKNLNYTMLKAQYGVYFANKIFLQRSATWSKPIQSKYGLHLIYVTSKNTTDSYDFNEVIDRVYQDYLYERQKRTLKEAYQKFSLQYELKKEL